MAAWALVPWGEVGVWVVGARNFSFYFWGRAPVPAVALGEEVVHTRPYWWAKLPWGTCRGRFFNNFFSHAPAAGVWVVGLQRACGP